MLGRLPACPSDFVSCWERPVSTEHHGLELTISHSFCRSCCGRAIGAVRQVGCLVMPSSLNEGGLFYPSTLHALTPNGAFRQRAKHGEAEASVAMADVFMPQTSLSASVISFLAPVKMCKPRLCHSVHCLPSQLVKTSQEKPGGSLWFLDSQDARGCVRLC